MQPYTISIYFLVFSSAIIKYPNRGEVRELGLMLIFSLLIFSPLEKSCHYLAMNFILYFHHNYNILSTVFPRVCLWGTRAGIWKYVENVWNIILNNWIRTSCKRCGACLCSLKDHDSARYDSHHRLPPLQITPMTQGKRSFETTYGVFLTGGSSFFFFPLSFFSVLNFSR